MDLNLNRQLEFRGAPKRLAKNLTLDFELMLVAGVLVMTAATAAEVGAAGLDAGLRGFENGIGVRTSKPGLLLGNGGFDFFTG